MRFWDGHLCNAHCIISAPPQRQPCCQANGSALQQCPHVRAPAKWPHQQQRRCKQVAWGLAISRQGTWKGRQAGQGEGRKVSVPELNE